MLHNNKLSVVESAMQTKDPNHDTLRCNYSHPEVGYTLRHRLGMLETSYLRGTKLTTPYVDANGATRSWIFALRPR